MISVGPSTFKLVAATPPNRTTLAFVRLVPVIVTPAPGGAAAGMVRILGVTVKVAALSALPASSETAILEVVAPVGTTTRIEFAESTVIEVALALPKATWFTPARFAPDSVTRVPSAPAAGVKLESVGGRITTKLVVDVVVPVGVVTLILPVRAPDGTCVVICVPPSTWTNDATTAPKRTVAGALKLVPVSVTIESGRPRPGLVDSSCGVRTKSVGLVAGPASFEAWMRPV